MFTHTCGNLLKRASRMALIAASACALVAMVAGCGVTTGAGGASSVSPTATSTQSALPRPCNGPDGSVSDVGAVALVLSHATPVATSTPGSAGIPPIQGSAHVGDVIQVQLPTTNRWSLSSQTGSLTLLSPSAVVDAAAGVCFWNFKATATGDTTLSFVGGALCGASQACPQYAILEAFLVHVS